jgi:hypothetical protein
MTKYLLQVIAHTWTANTSHTLCTLHDIYATINTCVLNVAWQTVLHVFGRVWECNWYWHEECTADDSLLIIAIKCLLFLLWANCSVKCMSMLHLSVVFISIAWHEFHISHLLVKLPYYCQWFWYCWFSCQDCITIFYPPSIL